MNFRVMASSPKWERIMQFLIAAPRYYSRDRLSPTGKRVWLRFFKRCHEVIHTLYNRIDLAEKSRVSASSVRVHWCFNTDASGLMNQLAIEDVFTGVRFASLKCSPDTCFSNDRFKYSILKSSSVWFYFKKELFK